jgi:hypothetical protein
MSASRHVHVSIMRVAAYLPVGPTPRELPRQFYTPLGGYLRSVLLITKTWTPGAPRPRSRHAAERTRSSRWRAGTRRNRRTR